MGAARWQVLSMVMKNGLRLVLLGFAIGEAMALLLHRTMQGLLVGVSATDALTLLVASAVLLIVAILACYVPAWRAARMDPLVALRFE
jgi:ABC-type antimicrobial peptide transport system permease subunit